MDEEMDEIWALYADDGAQSLDIAEEALGQISSGPGATRDEGIAALFRAVHTFKGNSRVLGLQVAESRAHLTEDLIGLVRDHGAPWDDEVESVMFLALDRLRVILETTATTRQDCAEDFGADLMERLRDKIARIQSGAGAETEAAAGPAPEQGEASTLIDTPLPPAEEVPTADAALEPVECGEAVAPCAPAEPRLAGVDTKPEKRDVLVLTLDLLGKVPLGGDVADRKKVLGELSEIAKASGYLRLADLAASLARQDNPPNISADVRLYEELYAIELSRSDKDIPNPSPRDLLVGWCAEHAFSLIDDLRHIVQELAAGKEIDANLRLIEPALRRIHSACDFYGLENAAQLAMSLLDLVLRVSPNIGRSEDGPDETVIRMLQTFISTVELALDAAKMGEPHDTATLEELSAESLRFDFTRRGALHAPQALEAFALPQQFLRVMSPRSVLVAQRAAEAGMSFTVVRATFDEDTDQAERFFAMMEDGRVRQITSVSVLEGSVVKFDFLLATDLGTDELAARLAGIDPSGNILTILSDGLMASAPQTHAQEAVGDGISVEMMEMLGEVSSGLATVIKDLRQSSEMEGRTGLLRSLNEPGIAMPEIKRAIEHAFDLVLDRIDNSLMAMEHLSRRIAAIQEEAMISRLRPADFVLRPVIDDLRIYVKEHAKPVVMTAEIDAIPLDRQTLDVLESACEVYVQKRLEAVAKTQANLQITLKQRDDRAILTIQDDIPEKPGEDIRERISGLCAAAGGRMLRAGVGSQGHGIQISLPTRMLAMEGMVVASAGVHYVIPLDALLMVMRAPADRIMRRAAAGAQRFLHMEDGEVLPIVTLEGGKADEGGLFLIVQSEGRRRAVLIEQLLGQEVVRLRPLQGVMSRLEKLAGMAVLAGGEVALVLSPLSICGDGEDCGPTMAAA